MDTGACASRDNLKERLAGDGKHKGEIRQELDHLERANCALVEAAFQLTEAVQPLMATFAGDTAAVRSYVQPGVPPSSPLGQDIRRLVLQSRAMALQLEDLKSRVRL